MSTLLYAAAAVLFAASLTGYQLTRRAPTAQARAMRTAITAACVLGWAYTSVIAGRMP